MEDQVNRVLTNMDSDEERLRTLGFLGIFKESFKIIFSWKKIFTQITLSFIFPLSIIFLVQIHVSDYLEGRIKLAENRIIFLGRNESSDEYLPSERLGYWLIIIAYLVFVLVLSLLSTSVVVYTVACDYTGKPITFKKIMSVVPKVWKRVTITFLWSFLIHLAYHLCFLGTMVMWAILIGFSPFGRAIWIILLIVFFIGFVYLSSVSQLASVVSILEEENYGFKAMVKSINLLEGKRLVTSFIFLLLVMFYFGIPIVYQLFVEYPSISGIMVGISILCLVLLMFLFLLGLVTQTVIYFVCKSYHGESIDQPALANHLEARFQSEPQRGATKDVQLEQVHVAIDHAQLDQVYV